jgi:hypothetical protein
MEGSVEVSVQVSVKHRGFKQCTRGSKRILFDDGDIVEFLENPAYITKGTNVCTLRRVLCHCHT